MLLIGVGNELRGDDGGGIEVARRIRAAGEPAGVEVRELPGESLELLDVWRGRETVVIVDAARSGAPPGTIRRFDVSREPLPARARNAASSHALALDQAIELARALGRLPQVVVVYTVEGCAFETGSDLSDELAAAIPALVASVTRELCELRSRRRS